MWLVFVIPEELSFVTNTSVYMEIHFKKHIEFNVSFQIAYATKIKNDF